MGFIRKAIVLCVIQSAVGLFQVVLSESAGFSQHNKENREPAEYVEPKEYRDLRQAVDFASDIGGIQNTTENIITDLQGSINSVLQDIEHALQEAGDTWNATVRRILVVVKAIHDINDDCILGGTPLDNVTIGFRNDVFGCFQETTQSVINLGRKGDDLEWKFNNLLQSTLQVVSSCGQSGAASGLLCWTENLPDIAFRTISLFIEAITTEIEFIFLKPTLYIKSFGCVAEAFGTRLKEAGDIDKTSIKCFSEHVKTISFQSSKK